MARPERQAERRDTQRVPASLRVGGRGVAGIARVHRHDRRDARRGMVQLAQRRRLERAACGDRAPCALVGAGDRAQRTVADPVGEWGGRVDPLAELVVDPHPGDTVRRRARRSPSPCEAPRAAAAGRPAAAHDVACQLGASRPRRSRARAASRRRPPACVRSADQGRLCMSPGAIGRAPPIFSPAADPARVVRDLRRRRARHDGALRSRWASGASSGALVTFSRDASPALRSGV